ncbi:uncharacterized protein METZ01_LOCUS395717 [marine metagenome]|uniref:Uncharacterized protein n=1 Tax=marine metagenome TaxID=408172 RepID=A0A382V8N2_9ZZZZ|tara:strand:- start:28 stop:315 length:288 start_codon:yes stop_codon:yes gene_type:complete
MIEDSVVSDTLERLYALAVTGQEQGAPKVALCARDAAETIMLLQGEIAEKEAEYQEKYNLTTELVQALRMYVANAEEDPVLGPSISEWIRLVRYE